MKELLLKWIEEILRALGVWAPDRVKTMRRRRRRWKRRASELFPKPVAGQLVTFERKKPYSEPQ